MISDYWAKPPEGDDYDAEEAWIRQIEDQAASPLLAWLQGRVASERFVVPGGSERFAAEVALKEHILDSHCIHVTAHTDGLRDQSGRLVVYRYCTCQNDDGVVRGEWPCEMIRKTAAVYADDRGYVEALTAEDQLTVAVHSTWYWKEDQ